MHRQGRIPLRCGEERRCRSARRVLALRPKVTAGDRVFLMCAPLPKNLLGERDTVKWF